MIDIKANIESGKYFEGERFLETVFREDLLLDMYRMAKEAFPELDAIRDDLTKEIKALDLILKYSFDGLAEPIRLPTVLLVYSRFKQYMNFLLDFGKLADGSY